MKTRSMTQRKVKAPAVGQGKVRVVAQTQAQAQEPDVVMAEEPAVVLAKRPDVAQAQDLDVIMVEEPSGSRHASSVSLAMEPDVVMEEMPSTSRHASSVAQAQSPGSAEAQETSVEDWPEIPFDNDKMPSIRKIVFNGKMLQGARTMVREMKKYKKYQLFSNLEAPKPMQRPLAIVDLNILERRLKNDFYDEPLSIYEDLLQVFDPAVPINDEDAKAYGLMQFNSLSEITADLTALLSRRSKVTNKLVFES